MPIIQSGRFHRAGFTLRTGFTLIELLVVIGIIAVLIGVLIPVYGKVRAAAYQADTQNELNTISNAITRYYTDNNAYPGPFSNDQIELQSVQLKDTSSNNIGTKITMSENLVLGLLGGLNATALSSTVATYDSTALGQGPLVLNPNNPRRIPAYMSATQGLLSKGSFVDEAGNAAQDTPIPEFVDRFPGGLPILYLRARIGASGVITNAHKDVSNANAVAQYDLQQIIGYTALNPANPNTMQFIGAPIVQPNNMLQGHSLQALGPATGTVLTNAPANAYIYFQNPSSAGRARAVDSFILIAAGKDGTYGTADDITTFGDVMP